LARRWAWERLARSLLSCVFFSHRSNSAGPNRSLGSISRTTRYTPVYTGAGSVAA